jgi:DNA-binding response OmpR family regulator
MLPPFVRGFLVLMGGTLAEKSITNRTILAVFPAGEDQTSLINIFSRSNWRLQFTCTLRETQTALSVSPGVVISEVQLSDGHCWSDLLDEMQKMECPPPLIVADRLADEHVWAEVLNLGGYDLLAKPFDAKEVLHAVNTACRRTEDEQEMARLRKPPTFAKPGAMPGINVRTALAGSAVGYT